MAYGVIKVEDRGLEQEAYSPANTLISGEGDVKSDVTAAEIADLVRLWPNLPDSVKQQIKALIVDAVTAPVK